MMLLFIVIGLVIYTLFMSQSDVSNIVDSKNFGTISTSLGSPFLGSSNASLTIIEFGNYQCDECQKWFQETRPIIITDYIEQGEINMIFIDTQLTKNIPLASFASYCANDQKKYWDYHSMLFQNSIENEIDVNLLKQFATELGLDVDSFEECLDSGKYESKVLANIDYAKNLGIDKIPVFKIINSEGKEHILKGGLPSAVFEDVVDTLQ